MVIWFTGISGAGKTTLCNAVRDLVRPSLPNLATVDGDVVREIFGPGLGFTEADRHVQIGRIQRLALALAEQDLVVLVGALYSHPDLLAWNRANLPGYREIYVKAPLELVENRDPKGLYAKARSGEVVNMVGMDIPWHEPANPDLVVDAALAEPVDTLARRIVRLFLPQVRLSP